jgi:hypothetical protein
MAHVSGHYETDLSLFGGVILRSPNVTRIVHV